MKRLVNLLTSLSLFLLGLTLVAGMVSYFSAAHLGQLVLETDPYGTTREYRRGVFVDRGCLIWSTGTLVHWPYEGPRKPAMRRERWGAFTGELVNWTRRPGPIRYGFGHYSDEPSDERGGPSKLGGFTIFSTSLGLWLAAFAVLPLWRGSQRSAGLTDGQVLGWSGVTWAFLVLLGGTAIVSPGAACLLLIYLVLFLGWMSGGFGVRSHLERRYRDRRNRCRVCGYDLRATPDPAGPLLERCPECGTYSRPLISSRPK